MASSLTQRKPYIAWKAEFSVGDPSLDAQHRQIIELIDELHVATQRGVAYQAIRPFLDQLVQYTVNHFQAEEKLLAARQYPDLIPHQTLHEKMRQRTIALRDNAGLVTGRDLLVFLKEWWCNHIQEQDKKYAPYCCGALVRS
jgi:methyl-accepting chemotaxis protein/hemerythrin